MFKELFGPELWKRVFFRTATIIIVTSILWQANDKNLLVMYVFLLPFSVMFCIGWKKAYEKAGKYNSNSLESRFYHMYSILDHASFLTLAALMLLITVLHSETSFNFFDQIIQMAVLAGIFISLIAIDFEARRYLPKGWKTTTSDIIHEHEKE